MMELDSAAAFLIIEFFSFVQTIAKRLELWTTMAMCTWACNTIDFDFFSRQKKPGRF